MIRILAATALLALGACATAQPDVNASVGSGGVSAGVGTGGGYAAVDVVETENVDVTVGTGGAGASVRVGDSPLRVGFGTGGWRIGI